MKNNEWNAILKALVPYASTFKETNGSNVPATDPWEYTTKKPYHMNKKHHRR